MDISACLGISPAGNLTIGGVDTVELAKTYKTPLYVMDEGQIRTACRDYRESIEKNYDGKGLVLYASKAFCCKEIYRIVKSEGLGADVVSAGELYTALSAGFPAENICFHGNNKTPQELEYALEEKVGYIVVDSSYELELLNRLAGEKGVTPNILFRIKPGIDAHTHKFIRTGQIDSKFGVALENGEAMEIMKQAAALPNIRVRGIHCHIGSQIFDIEPFELAAERMLGFLRDVKDQTGMQLGIVNLGGGFGIRYTQSDTPVPYGMYMEKVAEVLKNTCQKLNMPVPFVMMEPGRSIVGPAGLTLYTVGAVKEIPQVRTYVAVDGGMTDNPRYALYQAEYEAVVANRAGEPKSQTITLAGKCCESGDLLGENMLVQPVHSGDIIAVLATGAYNYSMASNYNRIPRPAVVMVRDGQAREIIHRENMRDLLHNDL